MNKRETIKEQLKECIESIVYNEEINVEYKVVTKNNGVKLQGIMIRSKGDTIAPVIYIDELLEDLETDNSSENVEGAALEILRIYSNAKKQSVNQNIDVEFIKQKVLNDSYIDVMSKKDNLERLKNCPYIDYLDLAIVYRICVSADNDGIGTILITNDLLKDCGMTKEQLHNIALNNSKNNNMNVVSMFDIIMNMTNSMAMLPIEDVDLYVVINTDTRNANCLYTLNGIKELAEQLQSDLCILPSSKYEVLAIPYDDTVDVEYLKSMVLNINETMVDNEDVLSDNVYLYKRANDYLEVAF